MIIGLRCLIQVVDYHWNANRFNSVVHIIYCHYYSDFKKFRSYRDRVDKIAIEKRICDHLFRPLIVRNRAGD